MTAVVATQRSLDRLGRMSVVTLLAVAAAWFVVLPPEGLRTTGTWAAIVCGAAAVGLWWLRDVRLAVVAAPGAVWLLVFLQIGGGLEGWWQGTAVAALGTLVALATLPGAAISAVGALLTIVAVSLPGIWMSAAIATSPGLSVYRDLQFLAVYAITLTACVALRRVASQVDTAQAQAQDVQQRLLVADSRRLATSRIRRVVHDTVLNTLEAIANGVAAGYWPQLVERCRADITALDSLDDIGDSQQLSDVADSVRHLGLTVDLDDNWRAAPPRLVVDALVGASREALLNAAKHSGTDRATVRTLIDADAAWVEVRDDGQGFAAQPAPGIGLRSAVMQTMQDVGGYAVVDTELGRGTRVTLTWEAARERAAAVLAGLRRATVRFAGVLTGTAMVMWGIATTLDTGLADRPTRMLTLSLAALVCAGLLVAGYQRPPAAPTLVAAMAGLALVSLLLPLGDPFCASFQNDSALDARVAILLCLAAASMTWQVYPWAAGVSVGASILAAVGAKALAPTCGWDYAMSSLVACGIGLAAFGFTAAIQEQRMRFDAQAQARHHALSLASQQAAQAQARQSTSRQLERARELLARVIAGEPDGPVMRHQARSTAQRLRQWLLLIGLQGPVPALLLQAGDRVVVDGDPSGVSGDCADAQASAQRLRDWLPPEGTARIVVSAAFGTASVLACCQQPAGEDQDGWRDEDGWWLHLTWQPVDRDTNSTRYIGDS